MYDELEKLIDPSKNMQKYREALSQAAPPLIPFLRTHAPCFRIAAKKVGLRGRELVAIFIKDLTFLNDGNPMRLQGLINFDKLRMMADKVSQITAWSAVPYSYEVHEDIQRYIKNPPSLPFDKLLAIADQHEPRETAPAN